MNSCLSCEIFIVSFYFAKSKLLDENFSLVNSHKPEYKFWSDIMHIEAQAALILMV